MMEYCNWSVKNLPLLHNFTTFVNKKITINIESLSIGHLLNKKIKKMEQLNKMTDEQLAIEYMHGSNQAFDILLSRNQNKVFAYILFVVHDEGQANDIFQETFVKIIVKLQNGLYEPSGQFSAWCMRIAHNVIMDAYRKQKARHIIEPNEDNDLGKLRYRQIWEGCVEGQYVNEQVLKDVKKLMDKLPEPQREVVFMRFYQQMSFKEIADATQVSINTALGRMRYAVMNMRKMAKKNGMELEID